MNYTHLSIEERCCIARFCSFSVYFLVFCPCGHEKTSFAVTKDVFIMVDHRGIDLRCGGGRVAALECRRHSIHSRSRSIPKDEKHKALPDGNALCFWLKIEILTKWE